MFHSKELILFFKVIFPSSNHSHNPSDTLWNFIANTSRSLNACIYYVISLNICRTYFNRGIGMLAVVTSSLASAPFNLQANILTKTADLHIPFSLQIKLPILPNTSSFFSISSSIAANIVLTLYHTITSFIEPHEDIFESTKGKEEKSGRNRFC